MLVGIRPLLLSVAFGCSASTVSAQLFVVECLPPIAVWQHCPPPIFVYPACPIPFVPVAPAPMMDQAKPESAVPEESSKETPKASDNTLSPPRVDVIPNDVIPPKSNPIQPVEEATPEPAQPEGAGNPPSVQLLPPPGTDDEKIPSLRLPMTPGATDIPSLQLETPGSREAKSSPINAKKLPKIDLFPVSGTKPIAVDATRTVGFFNHTDDDLSLTVQGDTITLPKRHFVKATVPAEFRWHIGDSSNRTVNVPAASPGLEIVLRPNTDK